MSQRNRGVFPADGRLARYVDRRRPGWQVIWRLLLPNGLGPFYGD